MYHSCWSDLGAEPEGHEDMTDDDFVWPDDGLAYNEAAARARRWWNEWRGVINSVFNEVESNPTVRARIFGEGSLGAPGLIIKGAKEQDLQNGIVSGKPWHELTFTEQRTVTLMWHNNHFLAVEKGAEPISIASAGRGKLDKTKRRNGDAG